MGKFFKLSKCLFSMLSLWKIVKICIKCTIIVVLNFEKFLNNNKELNPHVIFERFINAFGENMKGHVNDESIDVVVITQCLCYSNDMSAMLREAYRVLVKVSDIHKNLHIMKFPNYRERHKVNYSL